MDSHQHDPPTPLPGSCHRATHQRNVLTAVCEGLVTDCPESAVSGGDARFGTSSYQSCPQPTDPVQIDAVTGADRPGSHAVVTATAPDRIVVQRRVVGVDGHCIDQIRPMKPGNQFLVPHPHVDETPFPQPDQPVRGAPSAFVPSSEIGRGNHAVDAILERMHVGSDRTVRVVQPTGEYRPDIWAAGTSMVVVRGVESDGLMCEQPDRCLDPGILQYLQPSSSDPSIRVAGGRHDLGNPRRYQRVGTGGGPTEMCTWLQGHDGDTAAGGRSCLPQGLLLGMVGPDTSMGPFPHHLSGCIRNDASDPGIGMGTVGAGQFDRSDHPPFGLRPGRTHGPSPSTCQASTTVPTDSRALRRSMTRIPPGER